MSVELDDYIGDKADLIVGLSKTSEGDQLKALVSDVLTAVWDKAVSKAIEMLVTPSKESEGR